MSFAFFASTGLLWADCYVEVVHDTCCVEKIDSLHINLSVEQTVSARCEDDTTQEDLCCFTKFLQYTKEYKKEILFYVLLIVYCLALLFFLIYLIYLRIIGKKKKVVQLNRIWKESPFIMLFIVLTLITDSAWFYLIVVAIILYYAEKWHLIPNLLERLKDIIKLLQGKLDIKTATADEVHQKSIEEAEEDMQSKLSQREDNNNDLIIERAKAGAKIESMALTFYERQYPNLQRRIRMRVGSKVKILDGLVLTREENIIFEIKYCTNIESISKYKVDDLLEVANQLRRDTGILTHVILCVVVPDEKLKEALYEQGISFNDIDVDFYTEKDISI